MKLKLEKQKVTTLSSKEMGNVNGGGLKRSQRKNGTCRYSRQANNAVISTFSTSGGGSRSYVTGCK